LSQETLYEYLKLNKNKLPDVLLCANASEAQQFADVLSFAKNDYIIFPDFRAGFGDDLRPFKEELFELFNKMSQRRSAYALLLLVLVKW